MPAVAVQVVEPHIPDRVRRPADIAKLIVAVLVITVTIGLGNVAVDTTQAVEHDLAQATGGLPGLLLQLFSWAGALGVIILPIAIGVDLLWRSRLWQLVHALLSAGIAAGIGLAVNAAAGRAGSESLLAALTRPDLRFGGTEAVDLVVVTLVALMTGANVSGRKLMTPLAVVVLGSAMLTSFLAGSTTALALLCSVMLGWITGLAVRLSFGTASTRPPGADVARELVLAGLPLTRLELVDSDDNGQRVYAGTTPEGVVDVYVLDRDTFGLASGRRLLSRLRLRGASTRVPSLSLRAELEHRCLTALSLRWAGVVAPYPLAVCDVGGDSAALALSRVDGEPVSRLGEALTDEQARAVVTTMATLQQHRIAYRGLTPEGIVMLADGRAGFTDIGDGDVAGDDISRRTDAAQVLVILGMAIGARRAVETAVQAVGPHRVSRALPLLQPLAMSRETRRALKQEKGLLDELRKEISQLEPSQYEPATIELRRVTSRGVVTALGGAVAAYFLLTQFAKVDFADVLRQAEWPWAVGSLVFGALTFAGTTLVLAGSVPIALRFRRTYMTQLAVAFSGLVAPAAIGNIALNTRYLQKAGLPPAGAAASVGLAQVAQFTSYVTLLVVSGVIAGTGPRASFTPPAGVVVALPLAVLLVIGLLALPPIRRLVRLRVVPAVRTVIPQILRVLQHRTKLTQLLGGALLLDASFVGSIYCATRAFGATAPLAAVAVVYFAGAIIGSAVPTPGGLGGIEAALSAGLIAVGTDSGTAVSAVLLYRLITYWLPIPFGWVSLNRLQRAGAI